MPESIRIASYFPAHPSAKDASKTVPAKFKDGNDREFTIDKPLVDFVAKHQGQTIEAEWEETQNGKWTNRKLTGAVIPTTPAVAEKPAGTGWGGDWDRYKNECIARENALTNAVSGWNERETEPTLKEFWQTVREFAAWNLEGAVPPAVTNPSPEQRAAAEALTTGGSYAEALNKQKPHVTATLPAGGNLADLARQAVIDHDNEEIPPPWVGVTGAPARETLKPSRGAVR